MWSSKTNFKKKWQKRLSVHFDIEYYTENMGRKLNKIAQ